jgi:AraC-like DNA-binding protein
MDWLIDFRIIYFLGAVNAFFFSFLIFSKKQKSQADKILAWWLIVMGLQVLYPFIYLNNVTKYQQFIGYEASISVLHPAGLFFYTKAMVGSLKLDRKVILIMSLLFISMLSIFGFMSYMPEDRIAVFHEDDFLRYFDVTGKVLVFVFSGLHLALYVYFLLRSNRLLMQYKRRVRNVFSNSEKIDLRWLRKLVLFFYAAYTATIMAFCVNFITGISVAYTDYIYYLLTVVFIFLIGYWGHQQGSVFSLSNGNIDIKSAKNEQTETNNGLSYKKEAIELEKMMAEKKPYLEPMLTIHDLAELLKMPSHQLSRVIHKEFGKNFYEYVNYYRIESFKRQIVSAKYQNFTILAVALECGFNSKSAFNRIFKEQTGLTPRDYKLQIQTQNRQSV